MCVCDYISVYKYNWEIIYLDIGSITVMMGLIWFRAF